MNIQQAKQEIINTLHAYFAKDEEGHYAVSLVRQRPLFLIGPPGIGKTQIMRQIAQEEQVGLVAYTMTHHTRQSAIGLPLIEERSYGGKRCSVTNYTMSEIIASVYDEMERSGHREGILFLDEINCVSETLAPTMLQFLQAKTFGSHSLPEGWLIVAAGNPPEYNRSVREFDVVTMDRIRKLSVEPDFEVWKAYAKRQLLHPAILSYLTIKPQYFCRIETTVDGRFFATPRGWEDLSELLTVYERLNIPVGREVTEEYLQFPDIAKDFANYLKLYYKYEDRYRVDDILAGRIDEAVADKLQRAAFDEKLSVIQLLLSRLAADCKALEQQGKKTEALRDRYLEEKDRAAALVQAEAGADSAEGGALQNREMEQDADGQVGEQAKVPLTAEELEALRSQYNEMAEAYETHFEAIGAKLEHAFDFMEAAFGTGDELVVFMTELNYNEYLIRFLKEYDCPRYAQYNERLQFDAQSKRLAERAREL